jgi:uncharacterized membrane protein
LHIATLRILLDPSIFGLTPGNWFWPYFAGFVVLAAGLFARGKDIAQARGLEKLFALAPIFIAIPMAVFGSQHFTAAANVSTIVPAWIPFKLFWTILVGVALEAAALSIAAKKCAQMAATLFAAMMIIFILTMHIPNIMSQKNVLFGGIGFRDLTFCAGALAFAAIQMRSWRAGGTPAFVTVARIFIGAAAIFFGLAHFRHPEFLPAIDFDQLTPAWMPGHTLWAYAAGLIFVLAGIPLLLNQKPRLAALCLAFMGLTILLFVFLPLMISMLANIELGLNYFVSVLLFTGSTLLLAESLTDPPHRQQALIK